LTAVTHSRISSSFDNKTEAQESLKQFKDSYTPAYIPKKWLTAYEGVVKCQRVIEFFQKNHKVSKKSPLPILSAVCAKTLCREKD
jgi:hypothetical protein